MQLPFHLRKGHDADQFLIQVPDQRPRPQLEQPELIQRVHDVRSFISVRVDHEDFAELPLALVLEEVDLDRRVHDRVLIGDDALSEQFLHYLPVLGCECLVAFSLVLADYYKFLIGDVEITDLQLGRRSFNYDKGVFEEEVVGDVGGVCRDEYLGEGEL